MNLTKSYYAQDGIYVPQPAVSVKLDDWTGYTDQGYKLETVQPGVPTATTYLGKKCCKFSHSSLYRRAYNFFQGGSGVNQQVDAHCALSVWVATSANTTWRACMIGGIGNSGSSGKFYTTGIGIELIGNTGGLAAGMRDRGTLYQASIIRSSVDTNWHHFVINFHLFAPKWTSSYYTTVTYIDGIYKGEYRMDLYHNPYTYLYLGNSNTNSNAVPQYIRDIRAYPCELSPEYIQQLYQEGL